MRDLYTRSLSEISTQDLCKIPLYTISVLGLYKRSCGKISVRDLLSRSLRKLSIPDLRVKISVQDLLDRISIVARREGSDRPQVPRGKHLKISTAPQRAPSDTPKVPRGLHKRSHNEHRATTRVIWQAQSAEKVIEGSWEAIFWVTDDFYIRMTLHHITIHVTKSGEAVIIHHATIHLSDKTSHNNNIAKQYIWPRVVKWLQYIT